MLKKSSKYLFFFGLITIFAGSQSLCAWPPSFASISSWFGTPKAIEPALPPKIDISNIPSDAQQFKARQKPKPATSNQSAAIVSPAPVAEKKKHSDAKLRFIAGDKIVDDTIKTIKQVQDTVAKTRIDSDRTMHDMRETALLIRFTVIPVAILSCILMVKSIFPNWFPGGSSPKKIGSEELD